jgi:cell wall-associated NlpC family hydrolase
MDLPTYPNACYRAISIVDTDLRLLPTHTPHFKSLKDSGKNYPFDNLQNSAVHPNCPLLVTHVSGDKSWVLVETGFGHGWVPSRDVARVDEAQIALWENSPQIAILKDETPIYDEHGTFLLKADIGAQFPGEAANDSESRIFVAGSGEDMRAKVHASSVSRRIAAPKPLAATRRNIALIANELINKPYGWGGLYKNRDCSSMLRDLFAPFDIWLPRHSYHQAMEGGTFVSLKGMKDREKEAKIVKEALPFTTLLWSSGHIMLYIGSLKGQALVFHNTWGIKTKEDDGKEGKKIIGKSVITSLHPAAALPNADLSRGDLIARIEGMTFLISRTTVHNGVLSSN